MLQANEVERECVVVTRQASKDMKGSFQHLLRASVANRWCLAQQGPRKRTGRLPSSPASYKPLFPSFLINYGTLWIKN